MIRLTQHKVTLPNLPEKLRGLRVAHLTDFHVSTLTQPEIIRHAVEKANAACPDILALTGDFVSKSRSEIAACAKLLAPLRARLGVFAVLGNHDYYTDAPKVERAIAELGITFLTNRNLVLKNGMSVAGLDDERCGRPDAHRALAGIPEKAPLLVLAHSPVGAERVRDHACLVLSGHTHGGQINLPLLTQWNVRRIGAKRYAAGWYRVGKAKLYVNRGLGNVGMNLRLFSPPELALFTLE